MMTMTDQLVAAALGVVAGLLTLVTVWLQGRKVEAYEQGDMILAGFGKMTEIAAGLAVVFPSIKVEADALKRMHAAFKKGWEDASFTTAEMNELYDSAMELYEAILKKVAELKR